ncbi:hypothetical protein HNQ60_002628 [Povalibacter uvarum]|uniref:Uncharacterized protein n=1 Tax=Povalibacter uvarum TaxID=732238 RepID=A0A841HL08_9GAMM|nr:hypothetical protein [Povalibacter uvarum]MBB6093747.1 hypothetical protein [Povalibacter uvarum]
MRPTAVTLLALTHFAIAGAFAQDDVDSAKATNTSVAAKSPATDRWQGIDANNDGIRDDLVALVADASDAARSDSDKPAVAQAIAEASTRPTPKPSQSGSRCMDYLLLKPKDQAEANLYLHGRANGAFGTHPCDPVASPLLERPLDDNYVSIPLGPVRLQYEDYK